MVTKRKRVRPKKKKIGVASTNRTSATFRNSSTDAFDDSEFIPCINSFSYVQEIKSLTNVSTQNSLAKTSLWRNNSSAATATTTTTLRSRSKNMNHQKEDISATRMDILKTLLDRRTTELSQVKSKQAPIKEWTTHLSVGAVQTKVKTDNCCQTYEGLESTDSYSTDLDTTILDYITSPNPKFIVPHERFVNPIVANVSLKQIKSKSVTRKPTSNKFKGSSRGKQSRSTIKLTRSTRSKDSSSAANSLKFRRNRKGEELADKPVVPTYQLSDVKFLKEGWTKLRQPNFLITEKIVTFGTSLSHPELSGFQKRKKIMTYYYTDGTLAALFQEEGGSFLYYPNREVAITIQDSRVGQKLIVYSMSKIDKHGVSFPASPLAVFDIYGNGVVYGYDGEIRLNYDQTEGALYDTSIHIPIHWVWKINEYIRQRRDDLDGVPPDPNDDLHFSEDIIFKKTRYKSIKKSKVNVTTKKKKKRKKKKKKKKKSKAKSAETKPTKAHHRKLLTRGVVDTDDFGISTKFTESTLVSLKKKTKKKGKSKKKRKKKTKSKSTKTKTSTKTTKTHSSLVGYGTSQKLGSHRTTLVLKGKRKRRGSYPFRELPPLRLPPVHPQPIVEIRPIALRICDYISLRIMEQEHIHVDFYCPPVHFRFHVGVKIHPELLVRIDKVVDPQPVNNIVPCYFELMHKRSHSLHNLHLALEQMRKMALKERKKNTIKQAKLMGYKYQGTNVGNFTGPTIEANKF